MVVLNQKNENHMADPNYKSVHLAFQYETDSHEKFKEHPCYECWSKSQTVPGPDRFLNTLTFQCTWMYPCLNELGSNSHRTKGVAKKVPCENNARNIRRQVSD